MVEARRKMLGKCNDDIQRKRKQMTEITDARNTSNHEDSELIWSVMPELINRHTSIWWFFLLFPRQSSGFGPKQLMFVTMTKVGNWFNINGRNHRGLDVKQLRPENREDQFHTTTLGWMYDGRQMHDSIFNSSAQSTLSRDGFLRGWAERDDGHRAGSEIKRSDSGRAYGLSADYAGCNGRAQFHVWGRSGSDVTAPAESVNIRSPLGGAHVIGWQQLEFEGDFSWPGGGDHLVGTGYFQRVCLNINPFPWKWIWALFEDQSVFSCFVPYFGPHLIRRGTWFFPQAIERVSLPLWGGGYFFWADRQQRINLTRRSVTPILSSKPFPDFLVECGTDEGDFVSFRAASHAHAQVLLDEKRLGFWPSRYNYNEYLFRIEDVRGQIAGRPVTAATVGNGYGNIEYTWGFGG
jgi:hypothetical protein